jgi:hypothetical protein
MSAPPTPREVIDALVGTWPYSGRPYRPADAILAALAAAPEATRLALARAMLPETHAVVPVEPSEAMQRALMDWPEMPVAHADEAAKRHRAMLAAARTEVEEKSPPG